MKNRQLIIKFLVVLFAITSIVPYNVTAEVVTSEITSKLTVQYVASEGGTIQGTAVEEVAFQEAPKVNIEVVPNEGYVVSHWQNSAGEIYNDIQLIQEKVLEKNETYTVYFKQAEITSTPEVTKNTEQEVITEPQGNTVAQRGARAVTYPATISSIFPDPALARVVAAYMGKDVSYLVPDQASFSSVQNFFAPNGGIKDLTGLDELKDLHSLILSNNQISDISNVNWAIFTSLQLVDITAQTPVFDPMPFNNQVLVANNQIYDNTGAAIKPTTMSNGGNSTVQGETLIWAGLPVVDKVTYTWNYSVNVGKLTATYTGTATIPLTNKFNLTFKDWDGAILQEGAVDAGTNITAPTDPGRTGYTFTGWTPAVPTTMPASDATYTATYTINKYTVTFEDFDGDPIKSEILDYGSAITAPPNPGIEGYTFAGWAPAVDATVPAKDVTYTATYTPNTNTPYKVIYLQEKLDGSYTIVEVADLNGTTDTEVFAPIKTYEGFTKKEGNASGFVEGDGSLIIQVLYTRNSYFLTFKSSGGDVYNDISGTYKFGQAVPVNTMTFTAPTGYHHVGWTPAVPDTAPANSQTYVQVIAPDTNIPYKVEHYQEKSDGTFELKETENLSGATDETVNATIKTYDGYSQDTANANSVTTGTVAADGSLVLKVYYKLNTYKATFNDYDDSEINSTDLKFGAAITAPTDPERTGYTFTGWTPAVDATMPANNVTYTATYSINQYTIIFNDFDGREIDKKTLDFGAAITAPADPERAGYTFTGWTPTVNATVPASNVTYTAEYTANTNTPFRVEYLQEQLDGSFSVVDSVDLQGTTGTEVFATINTYEGFTKKEGTTSGIIAGDGSLVIQVLYTRNSYFLTFKSAGGDVYNDISGAYKFGQAVPVKTMTFTAPDGYHHVGWTPAVPDTAPANSQTYVQVIAPNTDTEYKVEHYQEKLDGTFELKETENLTGTTDSTVNATIKTYDGYSQDTANANSVTTGTVAADGSLVLKVYYKLNTYKVTFNDYDDSEINATDLKFGADITAPTDPERTGYTFTGWTPAVDATMPANNVTYTATYSINQYTIIFNDFDGREIDKKTLDFGAAITAPTDPERTGYTFTGWTPTVDATVPANNVTYTAQYTANTDTEYKVEHYQEKLDGTFELKETENLTGTTDSTVNATIKTYDGYSQDTANANSVTTGTVAADGSLVLKVYYKLNTYKATFNDYDDSEINATDLKFGAAITAPTDPERTGYTFTGWTPTVDATMPANNVTYTATYSINQYTIIFNDFDGREIDKKTLDFGAAITAPTDPERAGYTFTGWTPTVNATVPASNVTYTAEYTANTNTPFRVEYLQEQLDGSFSVVDSVDLQGTTGTEIFATINTYEGFTKKEGTTSGIIAGDGSLVIQVLYTRNSYFLTFKSAGGDVYNDISGAYKFGQAVPVKTMTFTAPEGYHHVGWTPAVPDTAPANSQTYVQVIAPNTDTAYKVEHYQEDTSGGYALFETENLQGTTGTTVNATEKTYTGFSLNEAHADSKLSGTVAADGSLVLKVYYSRIAYKLTVKREDGSVYNTTNIKFGSPVNPSAPAAPAGYSTIWEPEVPATMPANDLELTFKFVAKTNTPYTVTHFGESGPSSAIILETERFVGTTDTTVTAVPKVFPGYVYEPNPTDIYVKPTDTLAGDGSTFLFIYYSKASFNLNFLDYNGSTYNTSLVKYLDPVSAPSTNPSRTGYTFTGWTPALATTMPANDLTYTAEYTINQYKVTFKNYDGSVITEETKDYGTTIATPDTDPTRPGYTFTGWTPAVDATVPANDVTYTATYTANTDTAYKTEYYQEQLDGTFTLFESVDHTGTTDTTVDAIIKTYTGYTHDATNADKVESGTVAANGSLVLKVYYTLNTYKATFNDYDDSEITTTDLKFGADITAPTDPTRTGYTFTGWAPTVDATMPANNVTYTAQYTANTDTAYKTEYYQEQLDGTFTLFESVDHTGTTDTTVDAIIKTYTGYTHDATNADKVESGTVAANGSLVLKVYYTLNTYKATFNDYDDSEITTTDLKFGADITAPTDPERTGYTFTGWTPTVDATMPANDVTYTATYSINQYTITFNDFDGREIDSKTLDFGAAITAPTDPERTGYTFTGWTPTVDATVPANNVTYTAQYTANTDTAYKTEYYQEQLDGTFTLFETADHTGTTDTTVDAIIKTYTGYTHDATNADKVESGTVAANGSLVLKVYYTLNTYTATFNDYDDSEITTTDLKFGADITAPTDPERTGYTFTGWTPTVDATMPANNVTYTATYSINQYTVTFNDFDGREIDSKTLDFGADITAPTDPERTGYTFTGWTPTVDATVPANNVTYTAQYTANTDTEYKVEHYQEKLDGTFELKETENLTGTTDTTVNATIKTYDGYTQDAANANSVTTGTVAADGSLVLKVYYKLNTYKATFNDYDDSEITATDLKFGADITAPTDPERTGYTFTGWTPTVDATMPANNVTYTATYSINQYTVTFNDFDGREIDSKTLDFGAAITAPTDPERVGYTFTGWTPTVDATVPANNVTYTAQYTANTDTAYKTEYYQEQLNGTFTLFETVDHTGTTDSPANADIKTYDGYTHDAANAGKVESGTIAADGSLVLKVYYKLITYKAIFNDYDDSEITATDLKFGADITAPADPERTGYTFTGWTPTVDATMPANDVTYTATYSINQYTVTFNDFDGREIDSKTLDFGAAITAPTDPERTGYTFTGWTPTVDATVPANNVTYTAQYTANTDTAYKVEYYVEKLDGTYELKETADVTGTTDTTVNATIKTYAGYTHDATNAGKVESGTIAADGSLVLKVYYTLNTYTATFNDYDDSEITATDLKFGADITAPADPERTGYTFTGWTPTVDATMPANNVTYTATYSVNQYTVTFNDFDGREIDSKTLDFGSTITAPANPVRQGYTFAGWTPTVDAKVPANDVTYTATYTANTNTPYKVEYFVEQLDGTFAIFEIDGLQGTTNTTVDVVNRPIAGFTQDVDNVNNVLEGTIAPDGSLILKSYYKRNSYTVTFKDYDGSEISSTELKFGADITVEAAPVRAGYTFTGWAPKVNATMPAHDVIYIAQYEIVNVPVPTANPGGVDTTSGRTCQDDGYPNGYLWDGNKCVASIGYVVPNTGSK